MSAQAGAGQACPAGVRRHAMRIWKAPGPGSLETGGMGGGRKQITACLRGGGRLTASDINEHNQSGMDRAG